MYYVSFTSFSVCVRNFNLIGSVEDHSAAVTSLKVNASGRKLLSCSAAGYVKYIMIFNEGACRGKT